MECRIELPFSGVAGISVICTLEQSAKDALRRRGLDDLWWGAVLMDEWPYVVGLRFAKRVWPLLEKSPLEERGLLTVSVPNSVWAQELSLLNVADRFNALLGKRLIKDVRFEIRRART